MSNMQSNDAPENSGALRLLEKWGFSVDYPQNLYDHAAACSRLSGRLIGDILSDLKLATKEQLDAAFATKPANVLSLEHLVSVIPALQENFLRVIATSRGIPFLATINDAWVESGVKLSGAARARLDELNAAYLVSPDALPIVVFSDLDGLLTFVQAGRLEKAQDPIRKNVSEPIGVALAPPTVVARAARNEGTQDNLRVVNNAAQDNFWAPQMAKTEAERLLARLLDEALSRRATDISFSPLRDGTVQVKFRIYGDYTVPDRNAVLNPVNTREITNFLISKSRAGDGGRLRKAEDGQITYKNAQTEVFIRASFIPADRFGQDFDMVSSSLRLLPRNSRNISLDSLNLHSSVNSSVYEALMRSQGLIVLAGPTGSGKSTTIAGVVGEHVKLFGNSKKRLSLEDPVERYLDGITQISVENNFAELIRALLRHDPDLIWVGEIRDAFSAAACVRAATSGHVVLSTVHANDSIMAFRAISNYLRKDTGEATGGGASLFDLAESVSLLIGQRLVKKLCPVCRQRHAVTSQEYGLVKSYLASEGQSAMWERAESVLKAGIFKARPKGCKTCADTGYAGELPVNEVLPATREVRDLLSRSEARMDIHAVGKHRLSTLAEGALALVAKGEAELAAIFI
jgi:type II secretory ATPase GspE/PulE/Tfp pilus assembly ATPase PilB-like protein